MSSSSEMGGGVISSSQKAGLEQAVTKILSNNFDADSKTCIITLIKVIDNVLQQPHNDKVRSIRLANPAFSRKVTDKQGHHVLMACGFTLQHDAQNKEQMLILDTAQEDEQLLVYTRQVLTRVAIHQLQCPPDTLPAFQQPQPKIELRQTSNAAGFTSTTTNTGFNIYQGQRYDGKSAAIGTHLGPPDGWKSKTEQQLTQLQQQQAKLQARLQKAVGGRDWTILLPGQSSQSSTNSNASSLPTTMNGTNNKEDAQLLAQYIQQQQVARQSQENRGFTTKAMRDLEKLKKSNVYSHTQLAIQFSNGVVVKANFLPQETIQTVMDGLTENVLLENPNVPLPSFELYVTPPRQLLDPKKSLSDLGLVPAAKLYVGWKQQLLPAANNDGSGVAWFIRPELLTAFSNKGPALPTSVAVVSNYEDEKEEQHPENATKSATAATADKRKKTKAEKEASLLARMLGK